MSRLILIPQFPQKMRYQEWFYPELKENFKKYFEEVIILGEEYIVNYDDELAMSVQRFGGMFSSIEHSVFLETLQIREYMELELLDDDILLLMDISFPGLFSNILYHKKPKKCFAYCHATSKNFLDYFESVRYSKFPCETAHSLLFDRIFIGSNYHKYKLCWDNTKVVGLPIPPFEVFKEEKIYDIISVARPTSQKIDDNIEKIVEHEFGKIKRKECKSWEEYYKFLSRSKMLLITSKEDTFNYSVLESIMNNTIVLAPNKLSFPELLPREFLYNNYNELSFKIKQVLNGEFLFYPDRTLNYKLCENFYKNIAEEMKG